MKAPINSIKHIVQTTLTLIQEQTIRTDNVIKVVDAQPTTSIEVVVGAVIKAVYFEMWLIGESAQPCTATWTIEKRTGNSPFMTQAQGQDLDNFPNKKNILRSGQGVIGDSNSNPIPIIREWIKIPKGKQRFGQGDFLTFNISCIGETDNGLEICGLTIFKEYQ